MFRFFAHFFFFFFLFAGLRIEANWRLCYVMSFYLWLLLLLILTFLLCFIELYCWLQSAILPASFFASYCPLTQAHIRLTTASCVEASIVFRHPECMCFAVRLAKSCLVYFLKRTRCKLKINKTCLHYSTTPTYKQTSLLATNARVCVLAIY